MQVREIQFHGFMSYARPQTVALPPTGIVLVTGKNGAGKSALLEAVSMAGWGKTIRGTDPRREGEKGAVSVETTFGMEITRSWNPAGKKSLDVAVKGAKEFAFENVTKAQEHIDEVLGEWETWRRSCVFSTAAADMFSTATDADRKRLLENLLGLRRFDMALERCRVDQKAAALAKTQAQLVLNRAQTRLEEVTRHLDTLRALARSAAPSVDLATLEDRRAALEAELTFKGAAARTELEAYRRAEKDVNEQRYKVEALQKQIKALAGSQTCPTCHRAWPDAEHKAMEADKLKAELAALGVPPTVSADRWKQADADFKRVQGELAQVKAEIAQAEASIARHAQALEAVHRAEADLLSLETEREAATGEVTRYTSQLAHLETTDQVLGTRGARAHLLMDALKGLEVAANVWLNRIARIDAPLTLRLSPYTEKKSGGTADAISLEVDGAGGGRGYKATSGGERRRIDVAIMLALAEVAQSAHNRFTPTMWFDEVFDALDVPDGIDAVTAALEDLSRDRCVVVITHNAALIRHLPAALRLQVDDGTVKITA